MEWLADCGLLKWYGGEPVRHKMDWWTVDCDWSVWKADGLWTVMEKWTIDVEWTGGL